MEAYKTTTEKGKTWYLVICKESKIVDDQVCLQSGETYKVAKYSTGMVEIEGKFAKYEFSTERHFVNTRAICSSFNLSNYLEYITE